MHFQRKCLTERERGGREREGEREGERERGREREREREGEKERDRVTKLVCVDPRRNIEARGVLLITQA